MSQDAFAHFVSDDTALPEWTGKMSRDEKLIAPGMTPGQRAAFNELGFDYKAVDRTPSGNTADEIRNVAPPGLAYTINDTPDYSIIGGELRWLNGGATVDDATDRDTRLKRCGLVWYEDQLSGWRMVGPAGKPTAAEARLKVLPLYMVKPTPGLEIEATDGEKYVLPADFTGDWFSVTSPKGVKLIA